ncbi:MAG: PEP-CTERM sorting domain-containing protein [Planctomycetota bacterium]|nr:MAG: PEP-CTERM sorting domain-containing protein [Planctomycetota bacterium]
MTRPLLACAVAALAAPALADFVTVYENDFSTRQQVGSEWVTNPDWNSAPNFGQFLGRFGQETQTLLLRAFHPDGGGDGGGGGDDPGGGPGGGGSGGSGGSGGPSGGGRNSIDYTLVFDLFIIDSWDGGFAGAYGPDYFDVAVNGHNVFHEALHSVRVEQNFATPDIGPRHLGFNPDYVDSIYRDVTLHFSLTQDVETLRIDFTGSPSSWSLDDESWGLDNVRLYAQSVPAPGSAMLAGIGLAILGKRRRSR